MSNDYEVGFGKTPKQTRFKKGRSGNPKGRPKGSRNFSTHVKQALRAPVRVNSEGRPRTVSTQEATLMRLREKALKGDFRAIDRLLNLARDYNDEEMNAVLAKSLPTEDAAILEQHDARLRRRLTASSADRADQKEEDKG